jgi:long-subunit fatty acid transport protein
VALGQHVTPDISLGLGVDFLRGDYEVSERWVYPADSEEEDASGRCEYNDVTGIRFTFGALVETFHRVDIAAVYRSPFRLKGDYEETPAEPAMAAEGEFEYGYPGEVAVGVAYHPRNLLMTTVTCDVAYTQWSDFREYPPSPWSLEEAYDPDLDDTFTYRLGVEHGFFDNSLARFGFMYQPSYADEGNTTAAFSLGLGLDVAGVRVDIGGQVGLREYDIEDGRVRETTTLAMATVTHTF